jgi:hypothetical protein
MDGLGGRERFEGPQSVSWKTLGRPSKEEMHRRPCPPFSRDEMRRTFDLVLTFCSSIEPLTILSPVSVASQHAPRTFSALGFPNVDLDFSPFPYA